jgi:RsiW-degrading membrane proteinase PrsW (M82 family)
MGVHRFEPTPRQELTGRVALVLLGLILAGFGLGLGYTILKAAVDVTAAGADRAVQFSTPLMVLAAFLALSGFVLAVLAFAPGRDAQRDLTPSFWTTVSGAFEMFWRTVGEWLRRG